MESNDAMQYRYLYKYMNISKGSLCVVTAGTLKYSDPAEFNDPFDCRPEYDRASALEQIEILYPEMKRRFPSITKEEMKSNLDSAINAGKMHEPPPDMKCGVLCLSRDPKNILMWSHYADNHRGFVVEFKVPLRLSAESIASNEYIDMDYLAAMAVTYDTDRPTIFSSDNAEDGARKTFFTKSTDWKYEQEERIISRDRPPGIYKYRMQDVLCSVIAGANIADESYRRLRDAAESTSEKLGREIKVRKACLERGKYGLLIE